MDMCGKILITCSLVVRTGLHIGGSGIFSPIGAVDDPCDSGSADARSHCAGQQPEGEVAHAFGAQ